ncbi:MAG: DUF2827 family protein, partial [Alphaproteobacteria bacterium]|nr:DUF2827 family protein [Alphaproteobacteria bacterium]
MEPVNIAITLNLGPHPDQSIWYNGANQNCVFLYQLLKRWPGARHVWLCHDGEIPSLPPGMMLDAFAADLRPIQQAIYDTDLLVEMNVFLGPDFYNVLHARGGRSITYRFGNDYAISVEAMVFGAHDWAPNPYHTRHAEVWTNPQHMKTCAGLFASTYRAPVVELPHLWAPHFVTQSLMRDSETAALWGYRPGPGPKRVGVFEPNINVVKTTLIPMLVAEGLFRRRPEAIAHLFMTNTDKIRDNRTFKEIALGLDIVQAGKATVEARWPFIDFAARHVEIVLSHQWENGLNYLFYEALHGGYPLVHNSPFLGVAGYFYPEF